MKTKTLPVAENAWIEVLKSYSIVEENIDMYLKSDTMKKIRCMFKQNKIIDDCMRKLEKFENKIHKNKKHTITIKNELNQLDLDDE